jgi:hypothetical protein
LTPAPLMGVTLTVRGRNIGRRALRSRFVAEAGRRNTPLQKKMAMTGHRSVETVEGYFRAGAAQVSAVARMMGASEHKSHKA